MIIEVTLWNYKKRKKRSSASHYSETLAAIYGYFVPRNYYSETLAAIYGYFVPRIYPTILIICVAAISYFEPQIHIASKRPRKDYSIISHGEFNLYSSSAQQQSAIILFQHFARRTDRTFNFCIAKYVAKRLVYYLFTTRSQSRDDMKRLKLEKLLVQENPNMSAVDTTETILTEHRYYDSTIDLSLIGQYYCALSCPALAAVVITIIIAYLLVTITISIFSIQRRRQHRHFQHTP